jgi:hypothetical protein
MNRREEMKITGSYLSKPQWNEVPRQYRRQSELMTGSVPEVNIQPATKLLAESLAEAAIQDLTAHRPVDPKWLRCDDVEYSTPTYETIYELEIDDVDNCEQDAVLAAYVRENRPASMFAVFRTARSPHQPLDDPQGLTEGTIVMVAERGHWPSDFFVASGDSITDGVWHDGISDFMGEPVWAAMAESDIQ